MSYQGDTESAPGGKLDRKLDDERGVMMEMMMKIDKYVTAVEKIIVRLCLALMAIGVFANVISRYFFGTTIRGAEEGVRFLMVWLVLIGGALAISQGSHLSGSIQSVIVHGKKSTHILNSALDLLALLFGVSFLYYCYDFFKASIEMVSWAQDINIPMPIVYLAFPLGSVLFVVHFIIRLVMRLKRGWEAEG
jgi:TRAP-type C4-dicarboxylate transport system permease small subunit